MKNIFVILATIVTFNLNAQFSDEFTIYTNQMVQKSKDLDSIDYKFDGYFEFYSAFTINKDTIIWDELEASDTIQVDQILITRNEVLYFWSNCDQGSYILAVSQEDKPYVKIWIRNRETSKDYFCSYTWDKDLFTEKNKN